MKYYSYHKTTGEFLGEGNAAVNPQEEGKFLVPAYATTIEPLEAAENEIAVFKDGGWEIQPDYRGQVYYKPDGETVEVFILNVAPEPEWTTEPPPPTLAALIEEKQLEAKAIYTGKIDDGFYFETNTFQINTNSRVDMTAIMVDFGAGIANPHGGAWRSQDNQMIVMNDTKVQEFIRAVKVYMGALYFALWAHKDAIAALTDEAAIDAYDLTTGWPSN